MSLRVERALGLVSVQDLGRRGHMHEAVPPGGALVPELLVAANRAVRNPDGAAGIEVMGQLVLRATRDVLVAVDGEARQLRSDEVLVVASGARRVCYLAIRGGIEAPLILDGRGTLLCAEIGRPLRAGDVLDAASEPEHAAPVEAFTPSTAIRIIAGPDLDAFAPDAVSLLTAASYRISTASDRVGTRLAGAPLPHSAGYRDRSRPMVIGALEVPADGQPIVLGPEHPTTGGYPIVAVIVSADLGAFFAIPLGGSVRFTSSR